jgi:type I restriction enzyme, R subunit
VRDLVNQLKNSTDPNYCVRVTANDGAEGERQLRTFQDNEKTIPTILTTSQKLSTGVDARNVRNIVLMRPINSMVEFKQIIGRGTRLFEGKDYFTIYDFVKAYEHFNDPEWDGEPAEPETVTDRVKEPKGEYTPDPEPDEGGEAEEKKRPRKVRIRLADGKERAIQHMVTTSFWSPDGTPMSAAEFIERLYGDLPELFKDEQELREIWGRPDTRKALLEGLAEKGYGEDALTEVARMIDAEDSDLFDVLSYIRFASAPISRKERVATHSSLIFSRCTGKQRDFLDFVLDQYVRQGVGELDDAKLPQLLELKYHAVNDAVAELGSVGDIRDLFTGFQRHLYEPEAA